MADQAPWRGTLAALLIGLALAVAAMSVLGWVLVRTSEERLSVTWRDSHAAWCEKLDRIFALMERSSLLLARCTEEELVRAAPLADGAWEARMDLGADGIWRSRTAGFDPATECALWVPPYAAQDARSRAGYLAVARSTELFGRGAVRSVVCDAYVITADGANLLVWPDNGSYVHDTGLEQDYRSSDWLKVVQPAANSDGKPRWTPPIYDPAIGSWWVGVSSPIMIGGRFAGAAGHNTVATKLLAELKSHPELGTGEVLVLWNRKVIFSNTRQPRINDAGGMLGLETLPQPEAAALRRALDEPRFSGEVAGFLMESRQLAGPGWTVVSLQEPGRLFAGVADDRRRITILVTAVTLLFAGGAFWLTHREARRHAQSQTELRRALEASRTAHEEARMLNQELERRVAERTYSLRVANEELESFAHSVAHDLRTPLRSITSFTSILEHTLGPTLDADGRDCFIRIVGASKRMSALIDDLLELARLTRSELQRQAIDAAPICRELIDELRAAEPARRVEFELPPEMWIEADQTQLRVVLQNLLGNAWKFTAGRDPGRIRLSLATVSGRRWLTVSDDGVGFDPTYKDKLFRPFQRLHDQREFPGTGIGLAMVGRVVQRHGGSATITGASGAGATVSLTLDPAS